MGRLVWLTLGHAASLDLPCEIGGNQKVNTFFCEEGMLPLSVEVILLTLLGNPFPQGTILWVMLRNDAVPGLKAVNERWMKISQ